MASFLNDIGGETVKRTLSLFLANVLGVKTSIIGLVEGISDSTGTIFQTFSGYFSDKSRKRKPFVVLGYFLAIFGRLNLFWANSWGQVLFFRFLDRTGKGINNAPRDALISASSNEKNRGRNFGFHRMMDNAGALVGLLIASLVVYLSQKGGVVLTRQTFHWIIILAIIPSLVALTLLTFLVTDKQGENLKPFKFSFRDLPKSYKFFLLLSFLFTLGNSSDAFLILKMQKLGLPLFGILLSIAAFSLTASIISWPAGNLSDKIGRKKLLLFGWLVYAAVYFGFGGFNKLWQVMALYITYGAFYGLTEGVAKAYITDLIPQEKRGTAFGIYNTVIGLTLMPASLIGGYLWQIFSPSTTFYFGGSLAIMASVGLLLPRLLKR